MHLEEGRLVGVQIVRMCSVQSYIVTGLDVDTGKLEYWAILLDEVSIQKDPRIVKKVYKLINPLINSLGQGITFEYRKNMYNTLLLGNLFIKDLCVNEFIEV